MYHLKTKTDMDKMIAFVEELKTVVTNFVEGAEKISQVDRDSLVVRIKEYYISLRIDSADKKYRIKQRVYDSGDLNGNPLWDVRKIKKYPYYY